MFQVAFFSTVSWSVRKWRTRPSASATVQTSFANVPESAAYNAIPSPSGVTTGIGRLNSSIRALFARESFTESADLAVELFLGLRMQPAVHQLMLGLSDLNVTLQVRVLILHWVPFVTTTCCARSYRGAAGLLSAQHHLPALQRGSEGLLHALRRLPLWQLFCSCLLS